MRTSVNVARVSAQLIRAAVQQLHGSTIARLDGGGAREDRRNALNSLDAIAAELDQYSPAFDPETTSTDARSAQSV